MDTPAALQCRNLTLRCMQPNRSILRIKEDTPSYQPSFRPQTKVPLSLHAYHPSQPDAAPALFWHLRSQSEALRDLYFYFRPQPEVLFSPKSTSDRSRKYFLPQKHHPTVVGSTSEPLLILPTAARSTFHPLIHLRSQSEAFFAS